MENVNFGWEEIPALTGDLDLDSLTGPSLSQDDFTRYTASQPTISTSGSTDSGINASLTTSSQTVTPTGSLSHRRTFGRVQSFDQGYIQPVGVASSGFERVRSFDRGARRAAFTNRQVGGRNLEAKLAALEVGWNKCLEASQETQKCMESCTKVVTDAMTSVTAKFDELNQKIQPLLLAQLEVLESNKEMGDKFLTASENMESQASLVDKILIELVEIKTTMSRFGNKSLGLETTRLPNHSPPAPIAKESNGSRIGRNKNHSSSLGSQDISFTQKTPKTYSRYHRRQFDSSRLGSKFGFMSPVSGPRPHQLGPLTPNSPKIKIFESTRVDDDELVALARAVSQTWEQETTDRLLVNSDEECSFSPEMC